MHPDFMEQLARERIKSMLDDAASDRLARAAVDGRRWRPKIVPVLGLARNRLVDLTRLVRGPHIVAEDQPQR